MGGILKKQGPLGSMRRRTEDFSALCYLQPADFYDIYDEE